MGIVKGGALRLLQSGLYAIEFLCAAIILGIYSYFLSVLADRHLPIATWKRAVEGLSGAACLYLIFATILTCCLGGVEVFAFIAMVLDVLFFGAMIAIAILTRSGASKCSGYVTTPLGNGQASSSTGGFGNGGSDSGENNATYSVILRTACKLNTACFAVALIAAVLFLVTAVMQIALVRHHKKEKRYGPSPSNNYTSGPGKRRGMFGRKNKKHNATHEAELGAAGVGAGAGGLAAGQHDTRPSHETGYTGSTVAAPGTASYDKVDAHHGHQPHGTHGGYYTQPQGTGVNPYGYDNSRTAGTATNY
ncbi:hypothetical protein BAUCODRAFT_70359 [Baudoinia panamericana UAMH 10762]|uniref:MARVEL domain-containing protein n=1 Tax=Baudoinia panamericana (strain UAMH 10762) TaxID=717646 RepID=M2NBI1_BAUPA|nr:uncharacterized protein BAUCODRAFT_70359 [Baudoinia panamericana UAMH 10762]EMC96494.1 hypothetical protein BAUCODRAFT_70359 [Baudoinia panamericana UAMH 10762]